MYLRAVMQKVPCEMNDAMRSELEFSPSDQQVEKEYRRYSLSELSVHSESVFLSDDYTVAKLKACESRVEPDVA